MLIVGKLHMSGGQGAYSYLILLWTYNCSKKYLCIYIIYNLLLFFSRSVMFYSFVTPGTVACQAPVSMRFPKQEYWSGFPFSPPRDLPIPSSPVFPAVQVVSLPTGPLGKPKYHYSIKYNFFITRKPHSPLSTWQFHFSFPNLTAALTSNSIVSHF